MIYVRLESQVCLDESYRSMPYLDTVSVPTIGYGTTRILDVPVTLDHPAITESVARQILRQDLFTACKDAQSLFARFDEMNHVRQEVLTNIAYNIGRSRLSGFVKLITAADYLDYDGMAQELVDSKWFHQVGQRGERLALAMKTGEWG